MVSSAFFSIIRNDHSKERLMKILLSFFILISLNLAAEEAVRTKRILKKQLFTNKKEASAINEQMRIIQAKMDDILLNISIGDWKKISSSAKELESNFILKSKNARKEIYTGVLPDEFVALDKAFHQSAQFIRVGANIKDSSTVNSNFFRMMNTCVKCHANYAPIRFDMFKDYSPPVEVPKERYRPRGEWK